MTGNMLLLSASPPGHLSPARPRQPELTAVASHVTRSSVHLDLHYRCHLQAICGLASLLRSAEVTRLYHLLSSLPVPEKQELGWNPVSTSGPLIPLLRPGALPDRDSWTWLWHLAGKSESAEWCKGKWHHPTGRVWTLLAYTRLYNL